MTPPPPCDQALLDDAVALARAAHKAGFKNMVDDARDKMSRGLTTEEEIRRVLI